MYCRVKQLVKDHKDLVEFLSVPEYCATPGHCSQTADLVRESGKLNLVSVFVFLVRFLVPLLTMLTDDDPHRVLPPRSHAEGLRAGYQRPCPPSAVQHREPARVPASEPGGDQHAAAVGGGAPDPVQAEQHGGCKHASAFLLFTCRPSELQTSFLFFVFRFTCCF